MVYEVGVKGVVLNRYWMGPEKGALRASRMQSRQNILFPLEGNEFRQGDSLLGEVFPSGLMPMI